MKRSEKLEKLFETLDEFENFELDDHSTASCTSGYDNDGSTGFEIFENGYELGRAARDAPIFYVEVDGSAHFFIGEEKHLLERFQEVKEELEREAEDNE